MFNEFAAVGDLRQWTMALGNVIRIRRDFTATRYRTMTFDEASRSIKKGDIIRIRKELEDGLSPNLCNQYSWTLLMVAAMEGNTSIGELLIQKGAELDGRNKF